MRYANVQVRFACATLTLLAKSYADLKLSREPYNLANKKGAN